MEFLTFSCTWLADKLKREMVELEWPPQTSCLQCVGRYGVSHFTSCSWLAEKLKREMVELEWPPQTNCLQCVGRYGVSHCTSCS